MKRVLSAVVVCGVLMSVAAVARAQVGKPVTITDANTISEADLSKLPHMTPALAKTVIGKRPFKAVKDLDAALGAMTKEQKTELYAKLWVPIDLNTVTDAEILLIPGVGTRMLREFKEYRPYTALAQFHREIGKYVDATELARLEQYVMVPGGK